MGYGTYDAFEDMLGDGSKTTIDILGGDDPVVTLSKRTSNETKKEATRQRKVPTPTPQIIPVEQTAAQGVTGRSSTEHGVFI